MAQVGSTKVVSQSGECKLGPVMFSGAGSMGEQECKRGAEYEISTSGGGISRMLGNTTYVIRTTKCPAPAPPRPRGVSATQWQAAWEAKLPDGVVQYKTPTSGTLMVLCKEKIGSSQSLMKEIQAGPAGDLLAKVSEVQPPGSKIGQGESGTSQIMLASFEASTGFSSTPLQTRTAVDADFFGMPSSGSLGDAPNPKTGLFDSLGSQCVGKFCSTTEILPVQMDREVDNGAPIPRGFGAAQSLAPLVSNVGDENARIAAVTERNVAMDPGIRSQADSWSGFQKNGQLGQPQYIGVDGARTVGQAIDENVRSYVQRDAESAVKEVTGTYASGIDGAIYSYSQGSPETTLVRDPYDGSLIYSHIPGQQPVLYTNDGDAVQTTGESGDWVKVMKSRVQTAGQMQGFVQAYTGTYRPSYIPADVNTANMKTSLPSQAFVDLLQEPKGTSDTYDQWSDSWNRWDGSGPEAIPVSHDVLALDPSGKITANISRDAFYEIQSQENQVYGIDAAASRIARITQGRTYLSTRGLAQDSGIGGTLSPSYALTPLPGIDRAVAALRIEDELSKYPPEYWQKANAGVLYTYASRPDMSDQVKEGGYASNQSGQVWINGNALNSSFFESTVHHELGHYNSDKMFVSDSTFGTMVYGPQYGQAYAGKSGYEAITSGKIGYERPAGFVESYGYQGGIQEDKATIVGAMFTNYAAVQQAMQTDPVLAQKVDILQSGFEQSTNGAMNQVYWDNLQPLNPYYQLSPLPTSADKLDSLFQQIGIK